VKFTWDARKEAANLAKHGVAFSEAQKAFDDPCAVVAFDSEHSGERELRWWLLGKVGLRVMLVRYTHRPGGTIRLIGAGYWKVGKTLYEKAQRKP
jgi:uncharacterized DUF497 family protein